MAVLGLSNEQADVLTRMYNFLVNNRSISPEAAASILGNVMQESSFNHEAVSSKGARGVYQLLGQNYQNYLSYLKNKNWNDGPLSQTSFVINEIFNGKDSYYDTYDKLKERQANGWKEKTADGKSWYKNLNDSIYFVETFLPREQAGTLPPRRTEALDIIKSSRDIPTITKIFMDYWERPSQDEANLDKRIKYANEIYTYFNKKFGGKLNYLTLFS